MMIQSGKIRWLFVLCLFNFTSEASNNNESLHFNVVFDSYENITDLERVSDVCFDYASENCGYKWLAEFNRIKKRNNNRLMNARFRYSTDINKENEKLAEKLQSQTLIFNKKTNQKARRFFWESFRSPLLKRSFSLLNFTIQSSNDDISERILSTTNQIASIYNRANPCFGHCLGPGETGIENLFENERIYDKLSGFWIAWRNVTGRRIKDLFVRRVIMENIGARENGYSDAASFELRKEFEETNFNETIQRLYYEILPFYRQLHGFVRYCLWKFYPGRFDKSGPIPAHILGNVWAQQWHNIIHILQKCHGTTTSNDFLGEATAKLRKLTVKRMFEMAENFYVSLGMDPMTPCFWNRSIISQIPGKLMDCHGAAYDLSNDVDFRIKMCTQKNVNGFSTIHHEMGHIQYFMSYKHQPIIFHDSANIGFHEAIGDTIALSVKTPEHLQRMGLINHLPLLNTFDIDYLLTTALEKVAFLPFAYSMASYKWGVYNGSVPYGRLNKHWWDLQYRYQGLKPPIERTEEDFDHGSKYHVAMGVSYIRYFTSFIYQFQFYEAMCRLSNHSGPLHRCDFYQSKSAGERLKKMMDKGRSQHWRDSLEILVGSRDITTKSLLAFFNPLYEWLKETNRRLKIPIGW